jgi:hypothetical protein
VNYENNQRPSLTNSDEFKILGKVYRCDGNVEAIRSKFTDKLDAQLDRIDRLKVNAGIKLSIYKRGFTAFSRWWLQEQDFSKSYIESTVRNLVIRYLCKWSGLAACANRAVLFLPHRKLGMISPIHPLSGNLLNSHARTYYSTLPTLSSKHYGRATWRKS